MFGVVATFLFIEELLRIDLLFDQGFEQRVQRGLTELFAVGALLRRHIRPLEKDFARRLNREVLTRSSIVFRLTEARGCVWLGQAIRSALAVSSCRFLAYCSSRVMRLSSTFFASCRSFVSSLTSELRRRNPS